MKNSTIVAAIENAWAAIREVHGELPHVRIVIATGRVGRKSYHGYFAPERWVEGDDEERVHEVLIAGERLAHGARMVFETTLHEAVHALAVARDIKDTSRQGRWHNAKFKALAEEMGLVVEADESIGHRTTDITEETAAIYAPAIEALQKAIDAHRALPAPKEPKERESKRVKLACPCCIEVSVKKDDFEKPDFVLSCGICGEDFRPVEK